MIVHDNRLVQVDDKCTLADLQIALDVAGALSLRVINQTGEGFAGVSVSLHMPGGQRHWGEGKNLVAAINQALYSWWEAARERTSVTTPADGVPQ